MSLRTRQPGARWTRVLVGLAVVGAFTVCPPAAAADVQVTTIEGTTWKGVWAGFTEGNDVRVQTAEGPKVIPLDGLAVVTFNSEGGRGSVLPGRPQGDLGREEGEGRDGEAPAAIPAVFHLADGGHLNGELLDARQQAEAVRGRTALGDDSLLPLDRLAGIQLAGGEGFPRAHGLFRSALSDRRPGSDVLITRGVDDVQSLRGRLEALGAARGLFVLGRRERTFRTEKIFGVVLAAGAADEPHRRFPVRVTLVDGSVFTGRILHSGPDSIRIETSLGIRADLPLSQIARIRFRSDRVVYLSDLEPVETHVEGIVHRPWPVRLDRSVSGGPLSINGRTFEKGIGVHSRTRLTFDLHGAYEKFAATVGVDDAVRPQGSVVFRVLGDAEPLFESGTIRGADAPRDVLVDVSSVKRLTLIVDYGDELDVADHADWCAARVLKPPGGRRAESR